MRIILDTDKRQLLFRGTISRSWMKSTVSLWKSATTKQRKKTFTGYINEMWEDCIANSDKCVKTGEKPFRKSDKK